MIEQKVTIRKVWRSELVRIGIFVVFAIAAPILSMRFPGSIVTGSLFSLGSSTIYLSFPLYWLLPFLSFADLAIRIYNVRYVVDQNGIEAWDGILSLRQSITRVRHEDVRSIETDQNVIERVLDVGDISIGTAATGGVEVVFKGVSRPKELQVWLQAERDEVQRRAKRRSLSEATEKVESGSASDDSAPMARPRVFSDIASPTEEKI